MSSVVLYPLRKTRAGLVALGIHAGRMKKHGFVLSKAIENNLDDVSRSD